MFFTPTIKNEGEIMDTLRGKLQYSPKERFPLQIFTKAGMFILWPLLEPTFWSLCGLYVEDNTESTLSYALTLSKNRDRVFRYESRENMFLFTPGRIEKFNVASHLDSLFTFLNEKEVVVEGNREYFKISAVVKE